MKTQAGSIVGKLIVSAQEACGFLEISTALSVDHRPGKRREQEGPAGPEGKV